jgi:hypothetical protein
MFFLSFIFHFQDGQLQKDTTRKKGELRNRWPKTQPALLANTWYGL